MKNIGKFLLCFCCIGYLVSCLSDTKISGNDNQNSSTIKKPCSLGCSSDEICFQGNCAQREILSGKTTDHACKGIHCENGLQCSSGKCIVSSSVTIDSSRLLCLSSTVSYSFPKKQGNNCFGANPSCSEFGVCALCAKPCVGESYQECDYTQIPGYQSAETYCSDEQDNDCDGKIDCKDNDCSSYWRCQFPGCSIPEGQENLLELPNEKNCFDGYDNDCDGKIDCDDEDCKEEMKCKYPGCKIIEEGKTELFETTESNCTDQLDNDCNGTADCNDPNCVNIEKSCCQCGDCQCNARDDCLAQGISVQMVGINFEDYVDMDYNDAVMCFTGVFSIINKEILSLKEQTVTANFYSISGCSHQLNIRLIHPDQCGAGTEETYTNSSAGGPMTFTFKKGTKLIVDMINLNDMCAGESGASVSMQSNYAIVEPNECRTTGG